MALARALHRSGYGVREIISRDSIRSLRAAERLARQVDAEAVTIYRATLKADLVWLCVPDRQINSVAHSLANGRQWAGKISFHSSGALSSAELLPLRDRGAAVASVHPLMTFIADVAPDLTKVPFALEGDRRATRLAREIVKRLGGESFAIAAEQKPAYHAFGAFVCPLVIALLATAEDVGIAAGLTRASIRRRLSPILQQTVRNYLAKGPATAFTGPVVRGDASTVAAHVKAIQSVPRAKEVYAALTRAAVERLPVNNKRELKRVLSGTGVKR